MKTEKLEKQLDANATILSRINNLQGESELLVTTLLSVFSARKQSDRVSAIKDLYRRASGKGKPTAVAASIPFLAASLENKQTAIMGLINELQTTNEETSIVFVPDATTPGTEKTMATTTGT